MLALVLSGTEPDPSQDPRPPLTDAQQPGFVRGAVDAVARRDAAALDRLFPRIDYLNDDGSPDVSRRSDAREAIAMLSGCNRGDVRLLYGTTYTVDYACPERRTSARGCESGDLALIVGERGSRRSLAVAIRRKFTPECPVFVPPPPPRPR